MKKLYRFLFVLAFLVPCLQTYAATFQGDRDDFRDETIYFAMTTRFYDGDPKNNVLSWDKQDVQIANNDPDWRGDFAGLIEKLDYIKALGFTAIWITPVTQNASGEDYHGYHSMDFSSVDLRYESRTEWGSSKDVKFQDLIDAAHAKGMKIVLDIVLNHTSNFGEAFLNPLFTRNQNIRNQATPAGALIPNTERLSANYFEQNGNAQYQERFKYFKNPQYDKHNYYHHYGTGWNWDLPNRWWGQIAGDCVDLNTENDVVAEYLVKCYGEFIKMGVDGFRIDTTGHISRLTFNTQFIPQFLQIAEQYKSKRLNGCPFFMFGECCARFGGVIYRDQHNLSSHFYTWKSDQSLINTFKSQSTGNWWDTQNLPEGHDTPVGPMIACESEKSFNKNSNNVFMQNGAWHTPDYSEYSGFSVIDFPMHYNFSDAASAVNIAKQGDHYYNDASYNVVYVDSHDYCPGPNDGTRFNGGTEQWAENLSLMFTFRGIPCIYYGSEVEFMKGKPIDVGGENNKTPRKESGRAYFGHYLEGNVSASDFGVYTATGNVATTLDGDLAHHIRRLNMIRAAVPALRKGQYTWDGCSASGGWAFKRAYNKNNIDSYALVAINGGATFSNLPEGTYVDVVTGQSYTATKNGSITVTAPTNKGQLRVLVKGWKGGKIGEDGKFMYSTGAVAHKGKPSFTDAGTKQFYTASDVIGTPSVTFNPAGGSFKTDTQTVTVALNEAATNGWYKVGNGSQVSLTPGQKSTFTIGQGMNYGETVSVSWSASDGKESYTGTVTYKKIDPTAGITVYVMATEAPYLYAWSDTDGDLNGKWPGAKLQNTEKIGENTYYYKTFYEVDNFNIIFNAGNDNNKTGDITGITGDVYYKYDGKNTATKITNPGESMGDEDKDNPSKDPSTPGGSDTFVVYFDNASTNWTSVNVHYWGGDNASTWPGVAMTNIGGNIWKSEVALNTTGLVFNNGAGDQSGDLQAENNHIYTKTGDQGVYSGAGQGDNDKPGNPSTPSEAVPAIVPEGRFAIFVKADRAPKLYVWDDGGKLNGEYPGEIMTDQCKDTNGQTIYYWLVPADKTSVNCIVNYNGDDDKTQDINGITKNTYLVYNGQKDELPEKQDVPSSIIIKTDDNQVPEDPEGDEPGQGTPDIPGDSNDPSNPDAGVGSVEADALNIWVANGVIYVEAPAEMDIIVVRIDGRYHIEHVYPGTHAFEGLPHGIYIVNGVKVMI